MWHMESSLPHPLKRFQLLYFSCLIGQQEAKQIPSIQGFTAAGKRVDVRELCTFSKLSLVRIASNILAEEWLNQWSAALDPSHLEKMQIVDVRFFDSWIKLVFAPLVAASSYLSHKNNPVFFPSSIEFCKSLWRRQNMAKCFECK